MIILAAFGVLIGLGIIAILLPYPLATADLFFTFVEEGEAKIIVAGKSYRKTILSLTGHKINENDDGNKKKDYISEDETPPKKPFFERWYGAYWVGIPPFRKIHTYSLRWVSYKPKDDNGLKKPEVSKEILDRTFVKDKVYYGRAEEVETEEGVPLSVEFLVTLKVVSPYRAIFLISNWVETVIDRTTQQVRVYIGTKKYSDLIRNEKSDPKVGFSGHMKDALEKTIHDDYGVKFVSCDILSINPPAELRKTTLEVYTADKEGEAVKISAKAEAEAIEHIGRAKAQALKDQALAFNENAEATQSILNAEVGKALGLGEIANTLAKELGLTKKRN